MEDSRLRGRGGFRAPQPWRTRLLSWILAGRMTGCTSTANIQHIAGLLSSPLAQTHVHVKPVHWVQLHDGSAVSQQVHALCIVHAGVRQRDSRVNAAKRTQLLLEKAISQCELFCSQLGCALSGQHQRDVGCYSSDWKEKQSLWGLRCLSSFGSFPCRASENVSSKFYCSVLRTSSVCHC